MAKLSELAAYLVTSAIIEVFNSYSSIRFFVCTNVAVYLFDNCTKEIQRQFLHVCFPCLFLFFVTSLYKSAVVLTVDCCGL